MQTQLDSYASRSNKKIQGWLSRIDAEILRLILIEQNNGRLGGSVAEVGVHHGRSFILLCLGLREGEKAYCIDVFDDQHLNKDNSGRGDRAMFQHNLAKFGIASETVTIDARSSELVDADDLLAQVGPVRLFSVDGGHWLDIVVSDLRLAEEVLSDHGVIALDDFHSRDWPDVSAGYFKWFAVRKRPIVPFAIGLNKLYLCDTGRVGFYQKALNESPLLFNYQSKTCEFQGITLPVCQAAIMAEQHLADRLKMYLKVYHPEKFAQASRS
jgi:hypothetical protein